MQVLERLGLLDELLAFEEPGKAMSLATASFHTLCCIMDTSVSSQLLSEPSCTKHQQGSTSEH